MKKTIYIIIGIVVFIALISIGKTILNELRYMGSPTGRMGPNYPYFITIEPTIVKNITVPKGTKLTYKKHFLKEGKQNKIMRESKLTSIKLPEGKTIDWGGVPINMLVKFFNSEMQGYTIYADFNQLKDDKKTKFSKLWQSSNNQLGVLVENPADWTFNPNNIIDISSCGVNNQRYFKEDKKQQQFLDELFSELQKIN